MIKIKKNLNSRIENFLESSKDNDAKNHIAKLAEDLFNIANDMRDLGYFDKNILVYINEEDLYYAVSNPIKHLEDLTGSKYYQPFDIRKLAGLRFKSQTQARDAFDEVSFGMTVTNHE